jgi:hypothetical protein
VGFRPTYAPLQLIPARTYTETFNLTDAPPAGGSAEIHFQAALFAPDAKSPVLQCTCEKRSNTLVFTLTDLDTVRLFTALDRGTKVGEWQLFPGPLATGPVSFRRPPGEHPRLPMWVCITPFEPSMQELVITLKGTDKGPYVPGTSYSAGDIVQIDGRSFYAFCDTDGSPGSGPNLDPNDPDSNTILPGGEGNMPPAVTTFDAVGTSGT